MPASSRIPDSFEMGSPKFAEGVWIAPNAVVVGKVELGKHSSVWYGAVLRGDLHSIIIGESSNVQDGVVIHLENDRGCHIGDYVTVGHRAIIHGATIHNHVVIGMGAIILNGAVIEEGAVVAAGALVKENQVVRRGTMVAGIPATIKKEDPFMIERNREWALKYVWLATQHRPLAN